VHTTELTLSDDEKNLLTSIRGGVWENLSGDMIGSESFAWKSVRLQTSQGSVEVRLALEVVDIDDDVDDFPVLHILAAGPVSPMAEREGSIYHQGAGQTIRNIWVIRDELAGFRDSQQDLLYVSDIAVVFELDSLWTALARTSHITDAFHIRRGPTREDLAIPDTLREWPSDLFRRYELKRAWIPIGVSA